MTTAVHPPETPPPPSGVAGGRAVESRDPATGEVWRRYPTATREDVAAAVARAATAQREWTALPIGLRVRALRRFHDALYRRRLEVADLLTRENGKPPGESIGSEVVIALDFARYYAERAPAFLASKWFGAGPLGMKRKRIRIAREPYGVIGIISPWNYPFMLSAAIALPALVTGNAVVLKPSEFTPASGAMLGELFDEAGVAPGVFSVVQGDGSTGAALCDADVQKIFFTGSVATGRRVAARCGERLVPCGLELGGSDPAIVLADADVQQAARGIAWGRFSNAGQTCVAPKRVFVEESAWEPFVAALADIVTALRVGAGAASRTEVGPVIRPEAVATLAAQRDDALAHGATVAAAAAAPPDSGGTFFPPTVLTGVPADARVLREETFGPLLPLVKVRDADEAVALANSTEFGLSASVWSRDVARAARVAARIEAGSVAINDTVVVAGMVDVPHGGVKQSGIGRTHAMAGLEECVQTKAIVTDRFASWRQAWWFGYAADQTARIDAYARLAHGGGLLERLGAIPAFLRFVFSSGRER